MKNISLSFLILTSLISINPSHAYLKLNKVIVYANRFETPSIPADEETILSFSMPSKKQLPPKNWSFLVWNLHKGADDNFSTDYRELSSGRDIIMNQEIYFNKIMLDVFEALPFFRFDTATSFFSGKQKIRTGIANISTVAPVFTQFVRTVNREPLVSTPKLTLITSYPIRFSRKNLTVVNIHGINFVSTKMFNEELQRIYLHIKDIPSPIIFAGDFNTWNVERLSLLNQYVKKLNLTSASFIPDNRTTFNGYPLDHFFHSSDIKLKSARADGYYFGSDHKPLTIEAEYVRSTDGNEYIPTELELASEEEENTTEVVDTSVF